MKFAPPLPRLIGTPTILWAPSLVILHKVTGKQDLTLSFRPSHNVYVITALPTIQHTDEISIDCI